MERRNKNESHPQWSELPTHITEMIADRLSFPDILRFASVCVAWRWVAAETTRRRRLCSYQFQPMVMFDYNFGKGSYGFFNFQESRVYWINIPEAPSTRCLGCSQDWLVLLDSCAATSFLLNPFTKTRIGLPISGEPQVLDFEKVILLSNPIDHISMETNKDCIVVALDVHKQLFFCRLGDKSWRSMPVNPRGKAHFLGSLVFHKGRLYSLSEKSKLWVRNLTVEGLFSDASKCRVAFPLDFNDMDHFIECYLVESQGNLLLVVRLFDQEPRRTFSFAIFKLIESSDNNDPDGGYYVWERQLSLDDDQALFVSRFCCKSISLSSGECVGLKRNSVYFSDDVYHRFERKEYPEMGIYHVYDERIERCLPLDLYPFENLSIWITPSI